MASFCYILQHQRYVKKIQCLPVLYISTLRFLTQYMLNVNLFNGLAFGDLRVSYHLVGRADLDEGELGIFSNLCSQRCFPTVRWT